MQKLLLLELNEVNFDFVRAYGQRGELPALNGLMTRHGLQVTESETEHAHLEPWIQWVTAHTGLTYGQHGVFRLGDIVDRPDLRQVWEILADADVRVGAVSPMNAALRSDRVALFVPDPWTRTGAAGGPLVRALSRAVAELVNENATQGAGLSSYARLATAFARYGRRASAAAYLKIAASLPKKPWSRALLLDRLLADLLIGQAGRLDFATLFLNAAAHIQHHYMFSAGVYEGALSNPDWYVSVQADPVLDVYRLYDGVVADVRAAFPDARLLIATGLHQNPYPRECFYWRLRDHGAFLEKVGVPFARVEPRMSRDFAVFCRDADETAAAACRLEQLRTTSGLRLFSVDRRDISLFVELICDVDIDEHQGTTDGRQVWPDLRADLAFVAIKNGEHDGVGYLIDTAAHAASAGPVPLTAVFGLCLDHFGVSGERARPPAELARSAA